MKLKTLYKDKQIELPDFLNKNEDKIDVVARFIIWRKTPRFQNGPPIRLNAFLFVLFNNKVNVLVEVWHTKTLVTFNPYDGSPFATLVDGKTSLRIFNKKKWENIFLPRITAEIL